MQKTIITISLFILTLSIPLFLMAHFTPWYTLNTSSETRSYLGQDATQTAHSNLTAFFRHGENLHEDFWSKKEIIHMQEVRVIYDIIFLLVLLSAAIIFVHRKNPHLKQGAKINLYFLGASLLILPVFPYFWSNIFHSTLFANDLWIMTPEDLSYFLFPLNFFIKSFVCMIILSSLLNLTLLTSCKKNS